ncbi:nicotinate (nicotinamide) nucleotide adenylyltransferase [Hydrogenothermus marinus]|uniref:Probable nicotinate-nucleotide adenylyltransferase n=1 Tax=Hydrogenothermus marinus TaxID=133270 RepID=A0A3M0B586_9AQUI|nr:nicotinate (nicotinamide) nucleotide adenylyltransferase [Hydrogenothermus marinus]RMA92493.1 nicotinate-nucleotide adenylyltransferase [Hydrogenothermus marinus]
MIALYGGSFDPVHIGHLRIAEDIREYYDFEKIIFIPAYISPLKKKVRASAEDRLNMLRLSIKDNPYFEISEFEIKKGGKSYTIDTIKHFKNILGYNPYFIVGTDAFLSFHLWKQPEDLLKITNFIVVGRGKDNFFNLIDYLEENFPFVKVFRSEKLNTSEVGIYYFDCRRLDISSTEIRSRIKQKKSIKYLVLKEVEDYILNKKLYLRGQ